MPSLHDLQVKIYAGLLLYLLSHIGRLAGSGSRAYARPPRGAAGPQQPVSDLKWPPHRPPVAEHAGLGFSKEPAFCDRQTVHCPSARGRWRAAARRLAGRSYLTRVRLVIAAATASRLVTSTKVVVIPHLVGKNDFSNANVPPGHLTSLSGAHFEEERMSSPSTGALLTVRQAEVCQHSP